MTVAARVAEETGTALGQAVGYGIRFEDVSTPVRYLLYPHRMMEHVPGRCLYSPYGYASDLLLLLRVLVHVRRSGFLNEHCCTQGVTQIRFCTDGVLLQEMLQDPLLTSYR